MGALDKLPTLAEVEADRKGKPLWKGPTRLEALAEQRPLTKIDEKAFKDEVWRRDLSHCRVCHRKVLRVIDRVPERGEVHHCHGRTGDLRFEARAAILTCGICHQRLTGKINARRLTAIATKTFVLRGETYTDARFPIVFKETT